jgi:hypothetical protein
MRSYNLQLQPAASIRTYRERLRQQKVALQARGHCLAGAENEGVALYDRVIAGDARLSNLSTANERACRLRAPAPSLRHRTRSVQQSQALIDLMRTVRASLRGRLDSPSARHRDDMIFQGLMG